MAAATVSVTATANVLNGVIVFGTITGHASGASGGDTVTASDFGLRAIESLTLGPVPIIDVSARWFPATNKVNWYLEDAAGVEAEVAGDSSASVADFVAFGKV